MSAAEALKAARAARISIGLDGDDLVLEASGAPPPAVLDGLTRYKSAIVALLRPANDGWTAEDWRAFFDKRAGAAESNGLSREKAEAQAFACCVAEWLNRHPPSASSERCLNCGGVDCTLLPFGTETTGHAWLHSACWPAWHKAREVDAIAALSAMGIDVRQGPPQGVGDSPQRAHVSNGGNGGNR